MDGDPLAIDELGSMKTQVVGSCKRAQLYSDYLTDDKGNLVRVGSQKELWRRLQSMQSDKRRLEEKSAELEAEDRRSRSKLAELLATLTGLEEKNKELVQEVDRFKAEVRMTVCGIFIDYYLLNFTLYHSLHI